MDNQRFFGRVSSKVHDVCATNDESKNLIECVPSLRTVTCFGTLNLAGMNKLGLLKWPARSLGG